MTFDEAWEKLKSENPDVFTRAEQMADDFEESIQYAYDQGFKSGYKLGKEERPHGKWKETGYETGALGITYRQTQCSNCGWEHALSMWLNFCPNCGADMRGERQIKDVDQEV